MRRLVVETIDPATQRIILKIVGFQSMISQISRSFNFYFGGFFAIWPNFEAEFARKLRNAKKKKKAKKSASGSLSHELSPCVTRALRAQ